MTDNVSAFVSELIRAANEIERLSMFERARLLQRAAATIRDHRDEIAFSDTPANDRGPGDIVFELDAKAVAIETFTAGEVAGAFLEAVDTIKAARILLKARREIEAGETEGEL